MQPGTSCCPSHHHTAVNSVPFTKNATPDKFFFKDPNNLNSRRCVSCYFCRLIAGAQEKKRWDKRKEAAKKQKELVDKGIIQFMNCPDPVHDGSSGSKYARNLVPVERFRRRFGDKRSRLVTTCIDCRTWHNNVRIANHHKRKDEAKENGRQLCSACLTDITDCRVPNDDGSLSTTCKECKEDSHERSREAKAHYKQIIMDRIKKHEVSCFICKKLYFRPVDEESFAVRELNTYVRDGTRYAVLGSVEYPMSEVLILCESLFELDVIELDHLPMKEQLARGIIKDPSEFAAKWKAVPQIPNLEDMDAEAVGCQHACARCHVVVTVERETVGHRLSALGRAKMDYVHMMKSQGCTSCGYMNALLPRFFDMDHIDNKLEAISVMVRDENVTLEQFVEECKKCRVLCKFCHKIRTRIQRQVGIRSLKVKPTISAPTLNSRISIT